MSKMSHQVLEFVAGCEACTVLDRYGYLYLKTEEENCKYLMDLVNQSTEQVLKVQTQTDIEDASERLRVYTESYAAELQHFDRLQERFSQSEAQMTDEISELQTKVRLEEIEKFGTTTNSKLKRHPFWFGEPTPAETVATPLYTKHFPLLEIFTTEEVAKMMED